MAPWGYHRETPSLPEIELPDIEGSDHWQVIARARLATICRRGTPLRRVLPSPVAHVGRLLFADGTVLLGRAPRNGDLAVLSVAALQGMIRESRRPGPNLTMVFRCGGLGTIRVAIVGIDQPD